MNTMFRSYPQVTSTPEAGMDVPYRSIPDMLRQRVADSPDRPALAFPKPEEEIAWLTWAEVDQRVAALAAGAGGGRAGPRGPGREPVGPPAAVDPSRLP